MMIGFFPLYITVTSFWILIYFLPKAIIHTADLTNSSDCLICPRDAKTNKMLRLIALPLSLETLTKIRGYYEGATLTSAQEPYFTSTGYENVDEKEHLIATETKPGLAVSLGRALGMAGRAYLCFETGPQQPDSHFVGELDTDILCNYTLHFNHYTLKWYPLFHDSIVREHRTRSFTKYSHNLTWGGETVYIKDQVYFYKSSSQLLILGISQKTGKTFLWSDFSSLPQFNIIHLIFRNLYCASPLRTHNRNDTSYLPLCSDEYLSDNIKRKFSDYGGFANIHNHTWFRAKGFTTEVSLQGTGFFFLCGQSLYLQLPRVWHGSCTVVAILPDVPIYQPMGQEFIGNHPYLSCFLKAIPIPLEEDHHY